MFVVPLLCFCCLIGVDVVFLKNGLLVSLFLGVCVLLCVPSLIFPLFPLFRVCFFFCFDVWSFFCL